MLKYLTIVLFTIGSAHAATTPSQGDGIAMDHYAKVTCWAKAAGQTVVSARTVYHFFVPANQGFPSARSLAEQQPGRFESMMGVCNANRNAAAEKHPYITFDISNVPSAGTRAVGVACHLPSQCASGVCSEKGVCDPSGVLQK